MARVLPFWNESIAPAIRAGRNVLIAAHGNSLRALIKHLDNVSDDDIVNLNIPRASRWSMNWMMTCARSATIIWAMPPRSRRPWPPWRPRARPRRTKDKGPKGLLHQVETGSVMRRASGLLLAVVLAGGTLSARAAPNDLAGRQSEAERQQAAARPHREPAKDIDTREAARKEAADALKQSESSISRINLRLRELAEANRQAQADLGSLEKQIGAQQATLASAASSWPTSCAPSTPAACRPGRRCCPATIRNCWAAIWATWITCPRPAPRRCRRCAPTSTGWPRCRARPTPVAPRSKKWWPRPPSRRPPWSASRKSAPRCWPSWKGRSPPSAPRPTSWAGTTSACRA